MESVQLRTFAIFVLAGNRSQIGIRGIMRSALGAKDNKIVYEAVFGMEQDGPAVAANVVNRMIWAGVERTKGPVEVAGNDLPIHLHFLRPFHLDGSFEPSVRKSLSQIAQLADFSNPPLAS